MEPAPEWTLRKEWRYEEEKSKPSLDKGGSPDERCEVEEEAVDANEDDVGEEGRVVGDEDWFEDPWEAEEALEALCFVPPDPDPDPDPDDDDDGEERLMDSPKNSDESCDS